jgi:hypothetical protein
MPTDTMGALFPYCSYEHSVLSTENLLLSVAIPSVRSETESIPVALFHPNSAK